MEDAQQSSIEWLSGRCVPLLPTKQNVPIQVGCFFLQAQRSCRIHICDVLLILPGSVSGSIWAFFFFDFGSSTASSAMFSFSPIDPIQWG